MLFDSLTLSSVHAILLEHCSLAFGEVQVAQKTQPVLQVCCKVGRVVVANLRAIVVAVVVVVGDDNDDGDCCCGATQADTVGAGYDEDGCDTVAAVDDDAQADDDAVGDGVDYDCDAVVADGELADDGFVGYD